MGNELLYTDLANYYNLIYSHKDYKKEAVKVKKLILKYKKSGGSDLLEVGCGAGKHLDFFKDSFCCTGIDLNKGILSVAKKNVEGVVFKQGNMIDFDLKKNFDAITCLFSGIGYVKMYSNLKKTIKNFSRHLKPGGVMIIEPWFSRSAFKQGSVHLTVCDREENIKIARLSVSKVKGNISVVDMHYLVGEKGKGVRHFVDRHELGLFEVDKILDCMEKAGLKAKFLKNGLTKDRGLFIGVKK